MSRVVHIPAAYVRGAPRRGVLAWSVSLGATQAALLVAVAGADVDRVRAFGSLAAIFALAAALVVGTVWLLRLAIPLAPRAIGVAVIGIFYGGAALASPGAHALFASTLLAPAIAWAWWLPRGTFAIPRAV